MAQDLDSMRICRLVTLAALFVAGNAFAQPSALAPEPSAVETNFMRPPRLPA